MAFYIEIDLVIHEKKDIILYHQDKNKEFLVLTHNYQIVYPLIPLCKDTELIMKDILPDLEGFFCGYEGSNVADKIVIQFGVNQNL